MGTIPAYDIEAGDGSKPAVRMLYRCGNEDLHLGVTATTWTVAPISMVPVSTFE